MTEAGTLAVADINKEYFRTDSRYAGRAITAQFQGNADALVRPALEEWVRGLDRELTRLGLEEAVVDFTQLYFMNSSCLGVMVRWITALRQEPRYKVRFKVNLNLAWQKRSLSALCKLAPEIATVG